MVAAAGAHKLASAGADDAAMLDCAAALELADW
jgi:hypothetical protein